MPEPVLVSIATAVATKAALDLYALVKRRFTGEPEAQDALEAATADPEDQGRVQALAEQIDRVGRDDPEFGRAVQATWQRFETRGEAEDGGVVNQITGGVVGKSFQGRDVHGDVRF